MKASASTRRGVSPVTLFLFLLVALLIGGAGTVGTLQATGHIDLPFFRRPAADTHVGMVAVPISAHDISSYTMITRDHVWDGETGSLRVLWMKPEDVKPEIYTDLSKIIGRVVRREIAAGYAFREKDFLPEGTRPGMVAGIPPGKRSFTLEVNKIKGIHSLKAGDHFDLLATLPLDDRMASRMPENMHVVSGAHQVVPEKRATVKVIAHNGILVSPKTVRLIPVTSESLFVSGTGRGTRPVEEVIFALEPEEITALSQALAINAEVMCAARSGHPDDAKFKTVTPELPHPPMTVVETMSSGRRALATFPQPLPDAKRPAAAATSSGVVPASGTVAPKTP